MSPDMSSLFLHITNLHDLAEALNSKDFVDRILMNHELNWPR